MINHNENDDENKKIHRYNTNRPRGGDKNRKGKRLSMMMLICINMYMNMYMHAYKMLGGNKKVTHT